MLSAGVVEAAKAAHSTKTAGRPVGPHSDTALAATADGLNQFDQQRLPSYSSHKVFYKCSCGEPKHVVFVGVRSANHSLTALQCHVCESRTKPGSSSWEKELYTLCDQEALITEYSAEACSLPVPKVVEVLEGEVIHVHLKRWDVTVPAVTAPHGLLIEMQGQGHSTRLMSKAKGSDSNMAARQPKDAALRDEALAQGWSVLWLVVDEDVKPIEIMLDRWAALSMA
jgi:hypothetical protein